MLLPLAQDQLFRTPNPAIHHGYATVAVHVFDVSLQAGQLRGDPQRSGQGVLGLARAGAGGAEFLF